MAIGDFNMNTKVRRQTEIVEQQVRVLETKVDDIREQLNRIEKLLGNLVASRDDAGQ